MQILTQMTYLSSIYRWGVWFDVDGDIQFETANELDLLSIDRQQGGVSRLFFSLTTSSFSRSVVDQLDLVYLSGKAYLNKHHHHLSIECSTRGTKKSARMQCNHNPVVTFFFVLFSFHIESDNFRCADARSSSLPHDRCRRELWGR